MAGDPLFRALARPQMVAGVTYPFFVLNGLFAAELFLIFKSVFVLVAPLIVHAIGYAAHLRDPHIMSLWLIRLRCCPATRNRRLWGANVYAP